MIRQNITKYSAVSRITVAVFFIAMVALEQMSQCALAVGRDIVANTRMCTNEHLPLLIVLHQKNTLVVQ